MSEEPKAKPKGYVFGRPTVWQDRFCDDVVEWGAQGKSITWMAASIGISRETVYTWIEEKPNFSDAINRARALCQKWWEDAGQEGMVADKFNSAVWTKNMASRFKDDWTDTQNVNHGGEVKFEPIDRPEKESRDEWLARRSRELGSIAALGTAARAPD